MNNLNIIAHLGTVKDITENSVFVEIDVKSACDTCHAKNSCLVLENEGKIVEIDNKEYSYKIGDKVKVIMKPSLGLKAVFLGYLLPFLVLVCALFIMSIFTESEAIIGVVSILTLFFYYLILYFFRNEIKGTFRLSLSDDLKR